MEVFKWSKYFLYLLLSLTFIVIDSYLNMLVSQVMIFATICFVERVETQFLYPHESSWGFSLGTKTGSYEHYGGSDKCFREQGTRSKL